MLLTGDAGNPDPLLAYSMYLQVYHDARIRFETGDYNTNLPECAARIASALRLFPEQKTKRLKLLLEATYSSFIRYQTNKLYSDLEFSKEIKAEIDNLINEFKSGNEPVRLKTGWQDLGNEDVVDVFDDFTGPPYPAYYTLTVKELKNNRLKFTMTRHSIFPDTPAPLSLSVQPWLLSCGLTDNLVFTIADEKVANLSRALASTDGKAVFDKLIVTNNSDKNASMFSFIRGGSCILQFKAEKIFFNKPAGETIK